MKIFQKGFNFGQDGPGNRLVYHLQGCNMKCIWCSNPEGMTQNGGKECSVAELFSECLSSQPMFFGGGGVTFTGGEATLQYAQLSELLMRLKQEGIHTALETNATSEKLGQLLHYIDYLIMDFKHYDTDVLKQFSGMGNETIKKNFEEISRSKRQLHVRIPLINRINTDYPERFAEYFAKHPSENTVFEFLLYHEYGKAKWTEEYRVCDGFVSPETLERFQRTFREYQLKLITT